MAHPWSSECEIGHALPMSICPTAMSYCARQAHRFGEPGDACLVTFTGPEFGLGRCSDIEPLLMMRPPRWSVLHDRNAHLRSQERRSNWRRQPPSMRVSQILQWQRRRSRCRIVEEYVEAAEALFNCSNIASTDSGSPTSVATESAVPRRCPRVPLSLAARRSDGPPAPCVSFLKQRHRDCSSNAATAPVTARPF